MSCTCTVDLQLKLIHTLIVSILK